MGTGWRKAFCTTIPRDSEVTTAVSEKQQQSSTSPSAIPSPRSCTKLGFFTEPVDFVSEPELSKKNHQLTH
ncbi:hypothetical protein Q3G72_028801 [Acer saccharum]|nr:hypothetical protein Q3G72_028801 [Acer saccharum]